MRITQRDQFDGRGDEISAMTAKSFVGAVDVTRQEFLRETDVNYILQRYGLPGAQNPRFGEQFADVDLQRAIQLQEELAEAYQRLPERLRRDYGSWGSIIAAADRGELSADDLKVVDEQQETVTAPKTEEPKA